MTASRRTNLSDTIKRGLVIILEDGLVLKNASYWIGSSRRKILPQTIEAMYDRYLVKLTVESRHRRKHRAELTNVGEYAAMEIRRQSVVVEQSLPPHGITETVARFINEVV